MRPETNSISDQLKRRPLAMQNNQSPQLENSNFLALQKSPDFRRANVKISSNSLRVILENKAVIINRVDLHSHHALLFTLERPVIMYLLAYFFPRCTLS